MFLQHIIQGVIEDTRYNLSLGVFSQHGVKNEELFQTKMLSEYTGCFREVV